MAKKISVVILGLTPIFFLPVTQNYYDTNKWMLLTVGALLILFWWAMALFNTKKPIHIKIPVQAVGFWALALASLISMAVASGNKVEALISPFGPVSLLSLTILVIAASSAAVRGRIILRWIFYAAIGLLGLTAVYQTLGMGKLIAGQVPFLVDPLWTPTGSVVTTIALFLIALSLLVHDIITAFKKRTEHGTVALLTIAFILILSGTVVTAGQCIPKIPGGLLPFDMGLVVASVIFQNPRSMLTGMGVENFLTAFTVARPASLNVSPLSSILFTTNADFFLHMLTVYGVIGLGAALVLAGTLVSGMKKKWLFVTGCLSLAGLLLIPPTISLLAAVAAVLVLMSDTDKHAPYRVRLPTWIRIAAGILLLPAVAAGFYFVIRAYTADVFFSRSLVAARQNDGTKTYNLQIRAIETNTFVSRYHMSYSQTNLALANSIADSDRSLMGQLVQQAVKEAKIAVNLNPNSVAAWENLGLTYQTIIPIATDAAGWALTAYQRSAKLDPSNSTLFLNIGSVLVHQKNYDAAVAAFRESIRLNPVYANAYYNLANAYTLSRDIAGAATALSDTLNLVAPGSTDYYKVKNELDAIKYTPAPMVPSPTPATASSVLSLPQE